MKATLIALSTGQLETLRRAVQAEGIEVVRVLARKKGQALSTLLPDITGDLLVLEGTGERPLEDLASLEALGLGPGAPLVVLMSEKRDTEILLAAMRAGVRELLSLPPGKDELSAALRRVAQRQPGTPAATGRGRVIAFVSCKGGSGATFLATNLAWMLATEQGKKTALIDLDLQYGDASYVLTDGQGKANIADLTRQIGRLDAELLAASMLHVTPNLGLLAAPEDPGAALGINAEQLARVIEVAADSHDFVVVDLQRMMDAVAVRALDMADQVFLVMENMMPVVRDARRLVGILRALGYPENKLRLLVNRQGKGGAIDLAQLERVVGLKVSLSIPDGDGDVLEAVNTGVSLATIDPKNPTARALRKLAAELAEKPAAGVRGWVGRLLGEAA